MFLIHTFSTISKSKTQKVTFCCIFDDSFTADSDDITVDAGQEVDGHLQAQGSWEGSFSLNFKDENWNENVSGQTFILSSTMFVQEIFNMIENVRLKWQ